MCSNCQRASVERWDGFSSGCKQCQARAVSRSHAYFESRKWGVLTPGYQTLIGTLGLTHAEVKAAGEADQVNKERV